MLYIERGLSRATVLQMRGQLELADFREFPAGPFAPGLQAFLASSFCISLFCFKYLKI